MAEAKTAVAHKPIWTDLATSDAAGAREFYSKVFGWKVEVSPDPQYGGYALAKIGGKDVAGIGPKQMDEAPTAWTVYIGTHDAEDTVKKALAAGGNVVVPTMEVGDHPGPKRRNARDLAVAGDDRRSAVRQAEHDGLGRAQRARFQEGRTLL